MNLLEKHDIIACDCDEVLSDLVQSAIDLTGGRVGKTLISYDEITDYYIHQTFPGITLEQAVKFFHDPMIADLELLNLKQIHGSQAGLSSIAESGKDVHVVTARGSEYEQYTNNWLDKNYPKNIVDSHFAGHFTPDSRNKSEICKQIGATIILEDNIDYALECAHNGIEAILFDKPWNMARTDTHPLLHRVPDWASLLNK